jgi:hypothetical protein
VPIQVVLDGPPRKAALGRSGAFAVGSVLLIIGIAAWWPVVLLTFGVVWWLVGGPDAPSALVLPIWAGTGVLAWFAHSTGLRLVAGSRRMVLYLRRFGHTDATRTVTAAVARIGGYWRIVTLDDGKVSPVGVRGSGALDVAEKAGRRGSSVVRGIWGTVLMAGILGTLGLIALFLTGQDDVLDWLGVSDPGDLTQLMLIGAWAVVGACAVAVAGCLVVIVFAPFVAALDDARRNVREAEGKKALRITDEASIGVARQVVAAQSRRVISARLFVLKVATPVWRTTVSAFGADAAVPLIDVTEPTEHILWEIDRMRELFGRRCVFVGQYERLAHLFVIAEPRSLVARLQDRLDGCEVLAYRTADRGPRHFAHALRATLEAQVAAR